MLAKIALSIPKQIEMIVNLAKGIELVLSMSPANIKKI
jgi:hypothetical protein